MTLRRLVACELLGMLLCIGFPTAAVPLMIGSLAAAGYWDEPKEGNQETRRGKARKVAAFHSIAIALGWFFLVGTTLSLPMTTRVLLASMLGIGGGFAAGAAVLIGADLRARAHQQVE